MRHSEITKGKLDALAASGVSLRVAEFPRGEKCKVLQVPSHAVASVAAMVPKRLHYHDNCEESWEFAGGGSDDVKRLAVDGDMQCLADAREFAERLRHEMPATAGFGIPAPSVCGGGLSVPAHLAGSPAPFTRMEEDSKRTNPVRVYVSLNASAYVDDGGLRKRGMALLGLASKLAEVRPVELYAYQYSVCGGKRKSTACTVFSLGLQPVDWAMSGAILGSPVMYRCLSFALVRELSGVPYVGAGHMAFGCGDRRKLLQLSDDDVHIGVWDSEDADMDPLVWVQERLDEIAQQANQGR